MADRKAVNKYYPPDWDPSKGSANAHQKSHPLRHRARKIQEGILVVRFEMPFNIWCLGCENHVAMGVRFNAEKSRVGNYYTTPIYKFKMKCRLCDNHFEIQTDPSKFDYVILSGARRQVRASVEDADDLNQIAIDGEETKRKMTDAMFRLEKKVEDKMRSEAQLPGLRELRQWRSRWEDCFAANQLVRSQFRERRRNIEDAKERDKKLLSRMSLKIPLVKPSRNDTISANELLKQSKSARLSCLEVTKKQNILNAKIILERIKKEKPSPSKAESSSMRVTRSYAYLKSKIKSEI